MSKRRTSRPIKRAFRRLELQQRSVLFFVLSTTLCIALVVFLNNSYIYVPSLGKFLSPHLGVWQNALRAWQLPVGNNLTIAGIQQGQQIVQDTNGVWHVFAQKPADAYFLQGYLHARDRLWQMEYRARKAGGTLSEWFGKRTLQADQYMRRVGLKTMAEKTVALIQKDNFTRTLCQSYVDGVNAYIDKLSYADYPVEYKLYGCVPEKWSLYKTVLLYKLFTYDWGADEQDIFGTTFAQTFGYAKYEMVFPPYTSLDVPVFSPYARQHPAGLAHTNKYKRKLKRVAGVTTQHQKSPKFDWEYFQDLPRLQPKLTPPQPNCPSGSKVWVLSGRKTKNHSPVLAVDWMEKATLPNSWYEIELVASGMNVYGLSYPGVPGVLMGLTESMSWAICGTQIDVKDYLHIRFTDLTRDQYVYCGKVMDVQKKEETYQIRGGHKFVETLRYTQWGVVAWDEQNTRNLDYRDAYVMRWKSAAPSNDLKGFLLLNRAKNQADYRSAIRHIASPILYFTYADVSGNIGLELNGSLPERTENQGRFLSPGSDFTYTWNKIVPPGLLPSVSNPADGFCFATTVTPFAPKAEPFFVSGRFGVSSAKRLHELLLAAREVGTEQIQAMLGDKFSVFASELLPLLLHHVKPTTDQEQFFFSELKRWHFRYDPDLLAPSLFTLFVRHLQFALWNDELHLLNLTKKQYPPLSGLLSVVQQNLKESGDFIDDRSTKNKREDLAEIVRSSWAKMVTEAAQLKRAQKLRWKRFCQTRVTNTVGLRSLGGGKVANSPEALLQLKRKIPLRTSVVKMYVELTKPIRAYGSILGGQSGNPFSPFYHHNAKQKSTQPFREKYIWRKVENIHPAQVRIWLTLRN